MKVSFQLHGVLGDINDIYAVNITSRIDHSEMNNLNSGLNRRWSNRPTAMVHSIVRKVGFLCEHNEALSLF